nr:putative reverse transcriptase domain-containing protein [Tanacetum cinerariifolium]
MIRTSGKTVRLLFTISLAIEVAIVEEIAAPPRERYRSPFQSSPSLSSSPSPSLEAILSRLHKRTEARCWAFVLDNISTWRLEVEELAGEYLFLEEEKSFRTLTSLREKKSRENSKEKRLEEVPIVREFPEAFPEDFLRLSLTRQIKFRFELVSGVALVARIPYRLAHSELQELSSQLKELADNGFIQPNSLPWGALVPFLRRKMDPLGHAMTTDNGTN